MAGENAPDRDPGGSKTPTTTTVLIQASWLASNAGSQPRNMYLELRLRPICRNKIESNVRMDRHTTRTSGASACLERDDRTATLSTSKEQASVRVQLFLSQCSLIGCQLQKCRRFAPPRLPELFKTLHLQSRRPQNKRENIPRKP
jgi:hypothetical protein